MAHKKLLKSITVFIVAALVLSACLVAAANDSAQRTKSRYDYVASDAANLAISNINYALDRAFAVKALVKTYDGDTSFFAESIPEIYEGVVEDTGVKLRNIAIAPGGVVEQVYPLEGNEALIGFDFMDASKAGNKEAIEAYKSGEIIVTEPFELTQGGTGMGCRVPVFLGEGDDAEFWGIITLTIDYDSLVENLDFSTLQQLNADYEMWYLDEDGVKHTVASSEQAPQDEVTHDFSIRNITWHLSVAQHGGWIGPEWLILGGLLILVVSCMLALLIYQREGLNERNVELSRIAMLDSLTKCYRRQFITSTLLRAGGSDWADLHARYSMLMVDLDRFKEVNDTHGHTIGDEVIVATAQVLQEHTRTTAGDCVIRYGGDEFVVLLNDVTRERFEQKVSDLMQAIHDIRIKQALGLRLTCSIGGVFYEDAPIYKFFAMLNTADKRLYKAKAAGRDRAVIE